MRIQSPLITASLAAALAGCAGTAAQPRTTQLATSHSCAALGDVGPEVTALYAGKLSNVQPIHRTRFVARAIQPRYVAGAKFTVPAERGVTAAYLERTLSCYAAGHGASGHPNDPLRVEGIEDVDVAARGPSFQVSVIGRDRTAGQAILERARAIEGSDSQVQVEQVAAAMPAHSAL